MNIASTKRLVLVIVVSAFVVHAATLNASQVVKAKTIQKTSPQQESVYCSALQCWSHKPCFQHPQNNALVTSCRAITKANDDNDNPVPVAFVSRQNFSAINPYTLMASIVKGYIGDKPQSVMYCLGHKSHSLVAGKNSLLGQGYQHACAPEFTWDDNKQLQVKYAREMTWDQSCAPTLNPGRVLARCVHPIALSELATMKNESAIDTNCSTGDTYYSSGYFPVDKEPTHTAHVRELQIAALRSIFGTVCVPPHLTGSNGHALYADPYLITCQHERLTLFEMHDDQVPAVGYHAKVDSFFQKLGKLEKKRLVRMYQPKDAVVRFHA